MTGASPFKKVCFYLSSLHLGGAELQVLRLSRFFLPQGLPVQLLLDYPEGEYLKQVPKGVEIHALKGRRGLARLKEFRAFLERERPDIMTAGGFSCAITALASRLFWGLNTKCFVLVTGRISRRNPTFREKVFRLTPFLLSLLKRHASGFIAVSEDTARDAIAVLKIPQEKMEVIYNPVDVRELHRLAGSEEKTHKWLQGGDPPLVLAVGRLDAVKDFPMLVRAFAEVHRSRDARLIILGEGPERTRILKEAERCGVSEWVDLPGYVDNPFVFMKAADVVVVSSVSEGLSNVMIEALALGTPVVSTDCGGPREILQNGVFGEIVPVGDSEAMAAAIERVLENPPSAALLEARAKDFDLQKIGGQYLRFLSRPFEGMGEAADGCRKT